MRNPITSLLTLLSSSKLPQVGTSGSEPLHLPSDDQNTTSVIRGSDARRTGRLGPALAFAPALLLTACGPAAMEVASDATDVAVSDTSVCVVHEDSSMSCRGNIEAREGKDWAGIDITTGWACGVRTDGSADCWPANRKVIAPVAPKGDFVNVDVGALLACGLGQEGDVTCWGSWSFPGPVAAPEGAFAVVSAGDRHACGVKESGALHCWAGPTAHNGESVLEDVPDGSFIDVSVGVDRACAIRDDGQTLCWGKEQQLRKTDMFDFRPDIRPDRTDMREAFDIRTEPPEVATTTVSTAENHSCAVTDAGNVNCWGMDNAGQSAPPPAVQFSTVVVGESSSCGVTTEGDVLCWGEVTGADL